MVSLQDKVAVLTGASSGIGRALAVELAERGCDLVLAARGLDRLTALAEELAPSGGRILPMACDVTEADQVTALVRAAEVEFGRVDLAVACAGQYFRKPVHAVTRADLEASMAVNFYGAWSLFDAVLPGMSRRGSGHLVLISSVDAKKGMPLDSAYTAAKCAISGFAEALRQELRAVGIEVTTVFPGRVDTPMIDSVEVPGVSAKISAAKVAKSTVAGLRARRAEVVVPWQCRGLLAFNALSPRLGDALVRKLRLAGWDRSSPGVEGA